MSNKFAAVTGASRGIGRAIALRYAKEGYNVAFCCRHESPEFNEVKQKIAACGVRQIAYVGDMGNAADADGFFRQIRQEFGALDILVNNAGISQIGLLQDIRPEEWNQIISCNLNSVFYCSQHAIRLMLPVKSGKILSISSVWGCVGASTEVAYSTTKGGVNAFTKALAKELAPSGIQVNAIACGLIDTEMNAFLSPEEKMKLSEEIPAGRPGTPEEVAELAWQINQKNDYLTGQVIIFDGGWI